MLLLQDPVESDFELNRRFDFVQKMCDRRRVFSIETSRTRVQIKIKRKTKTKEFDFALRTKNVAKRVTLKIRKATKELKMSQHRRRRVQ